MGRATYEAPNGPYPCAGGQAPGRRRRRGGCGGSSRDAGLSHRLTKPAGAPDVLAPSQLHLADGQTEATGPRPGPGELPRGPVLAAQDTHMRSGRWRCRMAQKARPSRNDVVILVMLTSR